MMRNFAIISFSRISRIRY